MPLVYSCIAPHGGEVIPALAGKSLKDFAVTRKGMRVLAKEMKEAGPQTIVVASPHNLRMPKHLGVVISENTSGSLAEGDGVVRLAAKCDLDFGAEVIEEAEKMGLPVVGVNYGALEGPMSDLAMDWGTLVPLWFFLRGTQPRPKVLVVTPARGIPLRQDFDFGRAIAGVAERSRKTVALVASSDQAHAHKKGGPYGFHPAAKKYDETVSELIRTGRLAEILKFDGRFIEDAKPDSLWQMAILAGAASVVPMRSKLVSYQVPTYYGMLCASFKRAG